jgi:hypothetical protein
MNPTPDRLVNPLVRRLLRSPPHDLLSGGIALLTGTGRRTGTPIDLPVRYERAGETLTVASAPPRQWWRNLRGGAPVRFLLAGEEREGHASVQEGPAVAVTVHLAPQPQPPPAERPAVQARPCAGPWGRWTSTAPAERHRYGMEARPCASPWGRWTGAAALGEIAGFAVPAVAMALTLGVGPIARVAVILPAGAILGLAQAYALRTVLPAIATRDWARATAGGAAIAWAVGTLPVVLGESLLEWPPVVLVPLGLTSLTSMGLLRPYVRGAFRWVPATVLSWPAGLGAFALVTSPLWQEGQPAWLVAAIGMLGGAIMAVTVAAPTGAAPVRLTRPERPPESTGRFPAHRGWAAGRREEAGEAR